MKNYLSNLRNKIIWKIILIFWLTTIAVIVANIFITKEIVLNEAKVEQLKEKMRYLAKDAVRVYEENDLQDLRVWYQRTKEQEGIKVALMDEQHNVIGVPPKWKKYFPPQGRDRAFHKHMLGIMDQQITSSSGNSYTLTLLRSRYLESNFGPPAKLHGYRIGITFLFILLGSWCLARSVSKPVNILKEASREVAMGNLNVRVLNKIGTRKDELGELATTFDQMAEQIEKLLASQRQLFSDISHDIRTPLTRQKLAIELAREADDPKPLLDKLEKQNQVIDEMLNSLLTLFRLEDKSNQAESSLIDLAAIIETVLDQAELDFTNKGLTIETNINSPLTINGNRELMLRAFDNLISNAAKYAPSNSLIRIEALDNTDEVTVIIKDQGPGIPESELLSVLEPFYRADKSRNTNTGGYGLGLAITNKIIQQHHGRIVLSNSETSGLIVTISLPSYKNRV